MGVPKMVMKSGLIFGSKMCQNTLPGYCKSSEKGQTGGGMYNVTLLARSFSYCPEILRL
jgi:hypothetical protein